MLTPNFSATQSTGDITVATFEDTSTGVDVTITSRILYMQKYNSDYLVPEGITTDYVMWDIEDDEISVDVLDKDYALLCVVKWLAGTSIVYSKTILILFTAYSDQFLRQLTQAEAANRNLLNSNNFWQNKIKLRTLVDDATQAVELINDQSIATFCLNAAKEMTDNPQIFS